MNTKEQSYQELINYSRQNHGESSEEYIGISQPKRIENANELSIQLLLSMEKELYEFTIEGMKSLTTTLSYEYGLDPDKFVKIEFGRLPNTEELGATLFHPTTNKFYTGNLIFKKINEVFKFVVLEYNEK